MVFEGETQFDPGEQSHNDECEGCRKYYADAAKAAELMREIRQWEPELHHPAELTESIIASVPYERNLHSSAVSFRLITRLLAAAVVTLVLTLGIEQYMVLSKIQRLEACIDKIKPAHQPDKYLVNKASLIRLGELLQADNAGFRPDKLSDIIIYKRLKQMNFTFYDIRRYIGKENTFYPSVKKEKP